MLCVVLTYGILITFMLCYEFVSRPYSGKAPQDFIFSLLLLWPGGAGGEVATAFLYGSGDGAHNISAVSSAVATSESWISRVSICNIFSSRIYFSPLQASIIIFKVTVVASLFWWPQMYIVLFSHCHIHTMCRFLSNTSFFTMIP